jgi:hypothetical protein
VQSEAGKTSEHQAHRGEDGGGGGGRRVEQERDNKQDSRNETEHCRILPVGGTGGEEIGDAGDRCTTSAPSWKVYSGWTRISSPLPARSASCRTSGADAYQEPDRRSRLLDSPAVMGVQSIGIAGPLSCAADL